MTGYITVTGGKTYFLFLNKLKLKTSSDMHITEKPLLILYFQFVFGIKIKILKIVLNGAGGYESLGLCTYTLAPLEAKIMHIYSSLQLYKL